MFRRQALQTAAGVVFLAYGYVLLEWLFFATKPSFLTAAPFLSQLAALLIAALPFAAAALVLHGLVLLGSWALGRRTDFPLRLVPALICAGTGLILFDNFTYTVFGFSIARATWWRPVYVLAMGAIVWRLVRKPAEPGEGTVGKERLRLAAAGGLLLVSLVAFAGMKALSQGRIDPMAGIRAEEGNSLPNIVFFASDGINASRTSAYGYEKKTTPNLDARLDDALIFENAFTNSGRTTGSVTSMATGQHPATTKVLFPPYILQGDDAYHTLPRLLRKLGYRTIQESVRYYADGPDLNWQEAFDFANDRRIVVGERAFEPDLQLAGSLVYVTSTRLAERLLHLAWLREMKNPFEQVAGGRHPRVYGIRDEDRMRRVFEFIDAAEGPFFAHIHLMDTHCCNFEPKVRRFSKGEFATKEELEEASFDDTIFEADEYFGELMSFLEERKLLENTLVVFSSDHTKGWDFREQVPLIFFFPDKAHRGRRTTPAQLLDVAPTVLDYLGIDPTPWLEGDSLLREDLAPDRPLFAVAGLHRTRFRTELRDNLTRVKSVGPPTYGLAQMGLVVCDRWYLWKLKSGEVEAGEIPTHRAPCDPSILPSEEKAREMMEAHLRERGFSSLGPLEELTSARRPEDEAHATKGGPTRSRHPGGTISHAPGADER